MKNQQLSKLDIAKKKVEQIKGFYIHLTIYLMVNTMITVIKIVGSMYYGENFMGPIWHFSTFTNWFFWGIGLSFHAIKVFSNNPILGKEWEDRQIQKYIEKDKHEAEKFDKQ